MPCACIGPMIPVGQMIQMRRALRPDGLISGGRFSAVKHCTTCAPASPRRNRILYGGLSPRVAPMAEIRDLGALLQRAGFALPVADSLPMNVSYASPLST